MDKAPKKKSVSVNFSHTVVSFRFLDCWKWDQQVVPQYQYRIITLHCVISQKSADLTWWFGNARLDFAPRGPVLSDPVWRGLVQCFIHEFKMTSHI